MTLRVQYIFRDIKTWSVAQRFELVKWEKEHRCRLGSRLEQKYPQPSNL
jgi:hypothetical protein